MFKKLFIAASCSFVLTATAYAADTEKLNKLYKRSVDDAAIVQADEVSTDLFPINKQNQKLKWNDDGSKLLVLTWKSESGFNDYIKPYTKTSDNENYVVWVTAVPQLKRFCRKFVKKHPNVTKETLDLRLKQYLGLSHEWTYDIFAELWVSPDDLFRPCVDPDISDSTCNITFGDSIPTVKNIKNYQQFYQNLYYKDFRQRPGVPWTGLGYTYDWRNNNTEIGASEYILVPNSSYAIKASYSTAEYCGLK